MDEQDACLLNTDDKITTNSFETETGKSSEKNSELHLDVSSEMYVAEAENEVITIVTQEPEREVFIYDRNDIDNTASETPAEYIQVCDSSSAFEEANSVEEKDINVDGVDEEEVNEKKSEPEKVNEQKEKPKGKNPFMEETQSKNFKNVILEDWEVEVPQIMENHDPESYTETVVDTKECLDVAIHNNKNCNTIEIAEVNEHRREENADCRNESSKDKSPVETANENSEVRKSLIVQNESSNKDNSVVKQNSDVENSLHVQNENSLGGQNENANLKDGITPQLGEKRLDALKCPKLVTKEEIVKILDDSAEKVIRPIVGSKDLFFSIELTKRLNQKLSLGKSRACEGGEKHNESDSCNNNNTVDDRQKIVDILEADEVRDWKSVPSRSDSGPKENGNDMEISKAIRTMEEIDSRINVSTKKPRKTPLKKLRMMDKELERTLALQQLREEFPSTRKRSRSSKKVNHIPFLASTVLEKAMTSPEVTTALKPGPPRRRPCYLPDSAADSNSKDSAEIGKVKNKEPVWMVNANARKSNSDLAKSDFEMSPNPIVKTYSVKRKSTDAESDIKTTLEAVAKALTESSEETTESKPKKQKTVPKESKNKKILIKKKRKLKLGARNGPEKKMKSELEKLLEDEGAVRMLYDTQHAETRSASAKKTKFKSTTGLKNDLVLKTKLVKNAVMRLSGVGADGVFLRGKRRSVYQPVITGQEEEPLFSSTPNIVLYKPKKKQRAEASRILYRHSSSESFASSEGYRRRSFDADSLSAKPASSAQAADSKSVVTAAEESHSKVKAKKSVILKKSSKKMEESKQKKVTGRRGSVGRLSTDSLSTSGSRLNLSNVPVRKSSRPRVVSKKYSIWSSTSMDSLSVESLGLKKLKKASTELGKKLNCKELSIMQYEHLVQIVLTPTTTTLKNSFNHEVLQELVHVFNCLSEEDSCRAVLLSSRGNTFCQGIDINKLIAFSESERKKGVSQLIKAVRDFILCLANFGKPLLAGVQGAAVGLGVTLLPYCDLVISSDTASFYTPYVKLGQAPEGAPVQTFRHINRQLVSELLFKSHKMTAADALKLGLVTQVIPEERFEEDLIMISRNMASQSAQGMQSVKFLLRKTDRRGVIETLEAEGELLEKHWNSSECLNNMIKFLNSGELQLKPGAVNG